MTKIVVNKCFGGFSLSPAALLWLFARNAPGISVPVRRYFNLDDADEVRELRNDRQHEEALDMWRNYLKRRPGDESSIMLTPFSPDEQHVLLSHPDDDLLPRDHPLLVECVEKLGGKANGSCAQLDITVIPNDVGDNWHIHEYDGNEHVAENHRTWY